MQQKHPLLLSIAFSCLHGVFCRPWCRARSPTEAQRARSRQPHARTISLAMHAQTQRDSPGDSLSGNECASVAHSHVVREWPLASRILPIPSPIALYRPLGLWVSASVVCGLKCSDSCNRIVVEHSCIEWVWLYSRTLPRYGVYRRAPSKCGDRVARAPVWVCRSGEAHAPAQPRAPRGTGEVSNMGEALLGLSLDLSIHSHTCRDPTFDAMFTSLL